MTKAIGLVGCGRWGSNHLRTLQRLQAEGTIQRIAVCDIDATRLAPLSVEATYASMDEMLHAESLSGVAIVTPPETHLALVQRAFDANLPVLVEKPLSDDDEANQHFLKGLRGNETMVVGYILRHHPGVQHMLSPQIRERIGPLASATYIRRTVREKPQGADPLTTLAVHGLDLVALTFDACLLEFDVKEKSMSGIAARVCFADQAERVAEIDVAWECDREARLFEIKGAYGTASLNFGTGELSINLHGTGQTHSSVHQGEALYLEWCSFLRRIDEGGDHTYPSIERLLDQSAWLGLHAER